MKIYSPHCNGNEHNLFDCPGSVHPEIGLSVCGNLLTMIALYNCKFI